MILGYKNISAKTCLAKSLRRPCLHNSIEGSGTQLLFWTDHGSQFSLRKGHMQYLLILTLLLHPRWTFPVLCECSNLTAHLFVQNGVLGPPGTLSPCRLERKDAWGAARTDNPAGQLQCRGHTKHLCRAESLQHRAHGVLENTHVGAWAGRTCKTSAVSLQWGSLLWLHPLGAVPNTASHCSWGDLEYLSCPLIRRTSQLTLY